MNKKEIGIFLKTERLKQKKSYYTVLKKIAVTQPQVQGIESGEQNYCIDTLMKLCKFLKVDIQPKGK